MVEWILVGCSNNQVEEVLDPVSLERWLPSCRSPVKCQLRRIALASGIQPQRDVVALHRPNDVGHFPSIYRRLFLV